MMKRFFAVLCVALLLVLYRGGAEFPAGPPQPSEPNGEQLAPEPEIAPVPLTATLAAVGDDLIHDVIYQQAAARAPDGGYDFLPAYQRVQNEIASADLAVINQETPLAGSLPPSSYPQFNTPPALAQTLCELGFDVANLANNHILDQGKDGLVQTVELLRGVDGIIPAGVYLDDWEYSHPPVVERGGIRFAFLGFTQHTNAPRLTGADAGTIVYTDEADAIRRQIATAHRLADVVVVSVHWGEENSSDPTPYQRSVAQMLAEAGADLVFGSHPHRLQPVEWLSGREGRRTLVFYSLGNFISAQLEPANLVGGVAHVTVTKNPQTGEVALTDPYMTFVVTHYGAGFRQLELYPLEEYTDELAARHGVPLSPGERFDRAWIERLIAGSIDSRFTGISTDR